MFKYKINFYYTIINYQFIKLFKDTCSDESNISNRRCLKDGIIEDCL